VKITGILKWIARITGILKWIVRITGILKWFCEDNWNIEVVVRG
jgi:hypothetical protein